jgi:hypothetical protein
MSTNFHPLPSGGFTGLKPKQQPEPSQDFLPMLLVYHCCKSFVNNPDYIIFKFTAIKILSKPTAQRKTDGQT